MIFSGHTQAFKCATCGKEYGNTVPTSILPIALTIGLGTFQWIGLLSHFGWHPAVNIVISLALGILFPYAVFMLFEMPSRALLRKCRSCGGELEKIYSGFYDGLISHPLEIVIYILSIAVPYTIQKMI